MEAISGVISNTTVAVPALTATRLTLATGVDPAQRHGTTITNLSGSDLKIGISLEEFDFDTGNAYNVILAAGEALHLGCRNPVAVWGWSVPGANIQVLEYETWSS